MRPAAGFLLLATLWISGLASGAAPGELLLVESARVVSDQVLVADVAVGPVPGELGEVVLAAGGQPGQSVVISRQMVLRKLVQAKLARGVRLGGAESCQVHFAGQPVAWDAWRERVQTALQELLPRQATEAPAAWLDFDAPVPDRGVRGDWRLVLESTETLQPGRNLVRAAVVSDSGRESITLQATLHAFGQVARARGELAKDVPLTPEQFQWEWVDLATAHNGLVIGPDLLVDQSLKRTLTAGDLLRNSDLRATPGIRAGDPVELRVTRGQVSVTVRAYARQAGLVGQTIPVRNELTGRLVNARIAGPGLVEWRR